MKRMGLLVIIGSIFLLNGYGVPGVHADTKKEEDKQLLSRIDFGNAYIMGQTIKSGAVYLLQRKKSDIHNILDVRENYRAEILEDFKFKDRTAAENSKETP